VRQRTGVLIMIKNLLTPAVATHQGPGMPQPPSPSPARSAFAPLRLPGFRALCVGTTINLLGNGVAPLALAFAVLDLTHSAADLGLVVGARSLFNVVFLLFGGVLADRLPRNLVMVGSGLLSAATQAVVAALVLTHAATIPLLLVLSAANGTVAAIAQPASAALVPQLVPAELMQSANALNRLVRNLALILGTSLGGILVAAVGPGWGLAVDAASFAVSAGFFFRLPLLQSSRPTAERTGLVSELREGWSEFRSRTWVWVIVVAFCFLNAALAGSSGILGPVIANQTFGRAGWGFILAAQTVGGVAGGLIALRLRPRRLLLVGCACMGAEVLLPLGLAFHAAVYLLAPAGFVIGICVEQFGVAWQMALQQEIPAEKLARVYSYDMVGSFVAIPLAQVATGPLAAAMGVRRTLLLATGLVAVSTLAMLAVRDVRALRVRRVEPQVAEEPVQSVESVESLRAVNETAS
jgi:MFS family permease